MRVKRGRRYTGDIMTAESALVSMLMGVGGGGEPIKCAPTLPSGITYYDYETSTRDLYYDGSNYNYSDYKTIPKDSLVIYYYKSWKDESTGKSCYYYKYYIFHLIIENIDTEAEEVIGIKDMQTEIEYMFQFNVKGGR